MALISVTISGNAGPLRNALDDSESRLGKFGRSVGKFAAVGGAAFAALGAAAIAGAGVAIQKASDLNETISKVGVIFGDANESIQKFADNAAKSLGQTRQQALDAAATFGIFGKSAGLSGEGLAKFSTDFTTLASDLASFNNTTPEQAINAIGAALRGESEPLRAYGVLLNDASLKAAALELGIYDGNGALTAQQKILAAQKVIYEQTTDAQGDFARTSDGLANTQRILSAQIQNIITDLGTVLLPIALQLAKTFGDLLGPTIDYLSGTVFPKLGEAVNAYTAFVQEKLVPVIQDFLIPAFHRIRQLFLESIVPAIKSIAIPIFEGLVRIFDTIVSKLRENRERFVQYFDTLRNVWQFIRDKVAPVLAVTLRVAFEIAAKAIGFLLDGFFKILPIFTSVVNGVVRIASRMVDVIVGMVNGVISAVNLLIRGFMALPSFLRFGIDISEIPKISLTGTSAVGGAVGGDGQSFGGMFGENRGAMPSVITPSIGGSITTVDTGAGGTGGGGRGSKAKPESTNVTVNVNTPLATKAEIGDAVIQAIRASNAIGGYLPFVASAF